MTDRCTFSGDREATLVAYLYDDMPHATRMAFATHLATCELCRSELDGLQMVRTNLEHWAPPEPAGLFSQSAPVGATRERRGVWRSFGEAPMWMQTAAAILCVGVALGAANINVKYDANGFSVRTGWLSAPASMPASSPQALNASTTYAPISRAELATIVEQLKKDLHSTSVEVRPAPDAVRQVRALVSESERKQQTELALRLAEAMKDVQNVRQSDLERIDRNFAVLQNTVVRENQRSREMIFTVDKNVNAVKTSLVGASGPATRN